MASFVQTILNCITGAEPATETYLGEKQVVLQYHKPRTAESVADQVVQAITSAEKGGKDLRNKLDDIVGECGWKEKVAEWVLVKLESVLREAQKLGPALKEAYDKSCEVAKAIEGFVQEHPAFCTVVALGVLVLIAPWAIEALGFGELGPIEGTFAAAWQSRYGAAVPKGSLFSFFQRLGMTWH